MQSIPAVKSLESVLPGQAESNVSEMEDSRQRPDGFNVILAKELETDKTSNGGEEVDETQGGLLGFALAMYEETSSEVTVVDPVFSEIITPPESLPVDVSSSPDVTLIDEQAVEGQGQGKAGDIINRSIPDQKISVTKEIVEMTGNPAKNSTLEHPVSELYPGEVIAVEAKSSDQSVFQKTGELPGKGIDVSQETDSVEVKEKPVTLSVDKEVRLVEETVGNLKPLSKAEGNEIKRSLSKESFEKIAQLNNSPKSAAHLSNDENSHAREDSGSFRSNQGSSALNLQKTTPQDSQVDFAQITTLNSTETVQGTIETAQGIAVDLSAEVDAVSVKEVKPQTVSRAFEDQLMDQVSNSVRLTMKQGGGEARMRLYPESLGELKIELSVENGVMKAKFLVDNAMVKDVIENNFDKLRDSLTNNGLKVESFSVSVDQQNKGTNLGNPSFSQFEDATTADTEAPVIDQHEGLPEHSKARSGADDSMINIFT